MPDLAESLQGRDLGHLRIIAELWGSNLEQQELASALLRIHELLLESARVRQMLDSLSPGVREALDDLARHAGRLAWAQFTRQYGEVREMGVAKRDRELPHKQPISAAEELWYLGFLARAFFDTSSGPEEFAYIPDDLLSLLPQPGGTVNAPLGRPASAAEYAQISNANDRLLDHACTLLAAARLGLTPPESFSTSAGEQLTSTILSALLTTCGLLDEAGLPSPEPVRLFLESSRGDALVNLLKAWKDSLQFNELRLLPDLSFEGNWDNDPLRTRELILGWLPEIPANTWWNVDSLIAAIKQRLPDFQRPSGDYDSWFIRHTVTGEYLRGFEQWEAVDGRLIRFFLTGVLHWLGVLDLACPESDPTVTAVRLSVWSRALLDGKPPRTVPVEEEPLLARSDARISAKRLVPRRVRYQLARFCEWGKETPDEYQYQVTPASLRRAQQQGLTVSQLLMLLTRNAKTVPPSLIKALERWDKNGSEARLERMVILRVTSVEVLQALRQSRASRFLGEPLGPATIAIKSGSINRVLAVLAELGYLGEIRGDLES